VFVDVFEMDKKRLVVVVCVGGVWVWMFSAYLVPTFLINPLPVTI
jgi:hypothetical protein